MCDSAPEKAISYFRAGANAKWMVRLPSSLASLLTSFPRIPLPSLAFSSSPGPILAHLSPELPLLLLGQERLSNE